MRLLAALALFCPGLAACEQIDVVVRRLPAPADATPGEPMDAATGDADADAAGDDGGDQDADTGVDADADTGAPIDPRCPYRSAPPPSGAAASVGEQVAAGLGRAICACDGYSGGALTVDARPGASGDVGIGGVGINAPLDLRQSSVIAGGLTVTGTDGISLGPNITLSVGTNLSVGGPLEGGEAGVTVAGDAEVGARIDLLDLEVGGTLTQTPGEQMLIVNTPTIGEMRSAAVQVPAPCDCDAAALLDVGALAAARAPAAEPLPDGPLPAVRCAEYSVDGGTLDALTLDVSASAAVYVTADLMLDSLAIAVAEGAELDVYLQGNLLVNSALDLGGDAGGGLVRFHVGGDGTIQLTQGGTVRGALYAPNAELVLGASLTVTGALFVQRVETADNVLVVHHDAQASAP